MAGEAFWAVAARASGDIRDFGLYLVLSHRCANITYWQPQNTPPKVPQLPNTVTADGDPGFKPKSLMGAFEAFAV